MMRKHNLWRRIRLAWLVMTDKRYTAVKRDLLKDVRYALDEVVDRVDVPDKDCTCHCGYPPCWDCVENSGLRETLEDAKHLRLELRGLEG